MCTILSWTNIFHLWNIHITATLIQFKIAQWREIWDDISVVVNALHYYFFFPILPHVAHTQLRPSLALLNDTGSFCPISVIFKPSSQSSHGLLFVASLLVSGGSAASLSAAWWSWSWPSTTWACCVAPWDTTSTLHPRREDASPTWEGRCSWRESTTQHDTTPGKLRELQDWKQRRCSHSGRFFSDYNNTNTMQQLAAASLHYIHFLHALLLQKPYANF